MPIHPSLIDVDFSDKFRGMKEEDYDEAGFKAAGAVTFPDKLRVPRSEWDDRIAEQDKHQSSALDFSARWTHQGNSHECVSHASIQAFEIRYNFQVGGIQYAFYGSPVSLYTRITGGRQWGGSNVNDALREMMARGVVPEHDGPEWLGGKGGQVKRFKVTVQQTSGRTEDHWPTKGWVSKNPEGFETTARHFRVLEAYWIPDREAHFSALFHRMPVVNGRGGHSICHVKPTKDSSRYLSKYRDSYNRDLYDSEGMTGNGYCIASVTMPNDPEKPAGADMKESV